MLSITGQLHLARIFVDFQKAFDCVNHSVLAGTLTGVPQESLLGPRLYSIYSNYVHRTTANASAEMFADDTTAFCTANTVDEVLINIQSIVNLNHWAKNNFMTIHPAKLT